MTATATAGPTDLARHVLLLSTPALWPAWPFLPVIRRTGGGEDLGVLSDAAGACGVAGFEHTVFLTNLFVLLPTADGLLAGPQETYDSTAGVIARGWRVD